VVKLITPKQIQLILDNEPNPRLRSYYKLGYVCGLRRLEVYPSALVNHKHLGLCLLITVTKGDSKPRHVPLPEENVVDWNNVKEREYTLGYLSKSFKLACKRAGIYKPYYTVFHALRHSYATNKVYEGMHLMELKNYMGHTTTKTTEKYAEAEVGYNVLLQQEIEELRIVA